MHIRAVIENAGGFIGFDRYMREALYAPGLGYYSAGATKFGAHGDFTTAPEVSTVFGQCLARQCAEALGETGGDILEAGPGTGRLAADILLELESVRCEPGRYQLLEVSADLRARQQATLEDLRDACNTQVSWLDAPPGRAWQGVIIANEVLDALPVRCFEIAAGSGRGRILERGVVARDDGFGWDHRPADDALRAAVEHIENSLGAPLPAGYRSEVCLELEGWLQALLENLERGLLLFSDYGLPRREYYLAERGEGTLICHYRHRAHDDPFLYPGLQDISAWVDFTAVAEAADKLALSLAGFTTQAHFLIGAGLEEVMQAKGATSVDAQLRLASEIKTLTLPGEMGERFKFIAFTRESGLKPRGFSFKDMQDKL